MKKGILLINLGTPDGLDIASVRRYLKVFLSDPRVVTLPWLMRKFILYAFILPFRPKKSAQAYQAIWTERGSPLLSYSQDLVTALQAILGDEYQVVLGMRYGKPSIESAIDKLLTIPCENITVLPLFPQYASSSTGSAVEAVLDYIKKQNVIPGVNILGDFYDHPGFIQAYADITIESIENLNFMPDHLLMSFHGLPESHVISTDKLVQCDRKKACPEINTHNRFCYRAQCFATARLLSEKINLHYSVAFQSRLGKTPWIKPYFDEQLSVLYNQGVRNLVVMCPAFVSDCLETLEEIGIRAKAQWLALGGAQFALVPCLNTHSNWVLFLKQLLV